MKEEEECGGGGGEGGGGGGGGGWWIYIYIHIYIYIYIYIYIHIYIYINIYNLIQFEALCLLLTYKHIYASSFIMSIFMIKNCFLPTRYKNMNKIIDEYCKEG